MHNESGKPTFTSVGHQDHIRPGSGETGNVPTMARHLANASWLTRGIRAIPTSDTPYASINRTSFSKPKAGPHIHLPNSQCPRRSKSDDRSNRFLVNINVSNGKSSKDSPNKLISICGAHGQYRLKDMR